MWIFVLVLRSCNHTSTDVQFSRMLSTKPCAHQIKKMYDLVRAAFGFFNLLKVDMFLNPNDIKTAQAASNNSLLYTPEDDVLDQFRGIPHMNPSFILLNMGYPMNFYWKITRCVSFRLCVYDTAYKFQKFTGYTYGPTTYCFNAIPAASIWYPILVQLGGNFVLLRQSTRSLQY